MDNSARKVTPDGSPSGQTDSSVEVFRPFSLWLVNDDASQLLVQKRLLGRVATTVESFLSPLEALAAARVGESSPNLITDFHMPGMSGPELAKMWCELHKDARVIIVSASDVTAKDRLALEDLPGESVRFLTSYRIVELQEKAKRWFGEGSAQERGGETGPPATVTASNTNQRIDPSVLLKIGALGGAAFVAKTVDRFATSGPDKIARIEAALKVEDHRTIHELSHALKGSCGLVGAVALSDAADVLELATAPDGDSSRLAAQVAALREECLATLAELGKPSE